MAKSNGKENRIIVVNLRNVEISRHNLYQLFGLVATVEEHIHVVEKNAQHLDKHVTNVVNRAISRKNAQTKSLLNQNVVVHGTAKSPKFMRSKFMKVIHQMN
jgi:hypothetical protein